MANYPLTEGYKHDFSSVEVNIAGRIFTAISELEYGQARTPGEVKGTRSEVLALTRGSLSAGEGSFSMPIEDAAELRELLCDGGTDGYGEAFFILTAVHTATGSATITDKLFSCTLTDDRFSGSAGSEDPTMDKLSFKYLRGTRNGLSPLKNQLK